MGGEEATVAGRSIWNVSNMTNSTPYEEDDARWCYEQRRAEVCVRSVMSYIYTYTIDETGICLWREFFDLGRSCVELHVRLAACTLYVASVQTLP